MEERTYQLELADYLVEKNGILYLPTGSGKTYISILVLKRLSHQLQKYVRRMFDFLLENMGGYIVLYMYVYCVLVFRPLEEGGKRSIFICNTVVLARQQCMEIRKATNLKVGIYTGDRNVDAWDKSKWRSEMRENQVRG